MDVYLIFHSSDSSVRHAPILRPSACRELQVSPDPQSRFSTSDEVEQWHVIKVETQEQPGLELVEVLRQAYPHLGIVVASAHRHRSVDAYVRGADSFLAEPLPSAEIEAALQAHMCWHIQARRSHGVNASASEPPNAVAPSSGVPTSSLGWPVPAQVAQLAGLLG